jgi:hypothetical protein
MDIIQHSRISCRKFGGNPSEPSDFSQYLKVHKFLDSSKLFVYDWRHRALLHNNYGIELCTRLFGDFMDTPDGKQVMVRDVAAEHIKEDCDGRVPLLDEWLNAVDVLISSYSPKFSLDTVDIQGDDPDLKTELKTLSVSTSYWASLWHTDFFKYILSKFCPYDTLMRWNTSAHIRDLFKGMRKTEAWMNKPQKSEILWLKRNKWI